MSTFKDTLKKSSGEIKREKSEEEIRKELEELKLCFQEIQAGKSKKARNEISISIQLLISHYLGFLFELKNEINDNAKTAYLLSFLFNKEGSENIRKKLSNVGGKGSELLTIENLTIIKKLFETIGLTEPLQKVKKDLDRISK